MRLMGLDEAVGTDRFFCSQSRFSAYATGNYAIFGVEY
jgi:hypothetical protein